MTTATDPLHGREPPGTALVLSGGGARGAYQVGVLQGLVEAGLVGGGRSQFDFLVGSSAGAINAAMLAAHADRLTEGIEALTRVWSGIDAHQVFRTDLRSLGSIGAKWVRDLSFGGVLRRVAPKSLLDTAPLRSLLSEAIPFERIQRNIEAGALGALALPATDLYTSDGVLFVQGRPGLPLWKRGRWEIECTRIGVEHLMASSAIPIFFPSVEIDGRHFGDGSIRNTAPLSPAINLGAARIVAIGVRGPGGERASVRRRAAPTVAQIAGALLDAVMIDAIEVDVEHSDRVNTSVISRPGAAPEDPFRWIDVLWMSPSSEFGEIAAALSNRIPRIVRYLMRGLGPDESTVELASYLLFDASFCGRLIDLGKADVAAREEEIRAFFQRSPGAGRRGS